MKGWENNAVQYIKDKKAGICPHCGSNNIKVEEYIGKRKRSLTFQCLECGSGDHLDGFVETKKTE